VTNAVTPRRGPWIGGSLTGGTAVLVYGATFAVMLFVLAPLLVVIALSISNSPFAAFPPHGFTLRWYWKVVCDPDFQSAVELSVGLALAATVASLALGIPAAFVLTRAPIPGGAAIQGLLLSPLVFPTLIIGLALLQFYAWVGMQTAIVNLFFGHALVTLPYVVRAVSVSLLLVDHALEEAARTLGASRWRSFWRITMPQIAPGVAAGALFAFMVSLDNYPISMWLADARAVPLPILLFNDMSSVFDPSIAAMASLMIVVGAIAVLLLERLVGLRRAMGI
jgi:putative spermidine/putrescine transport system permease protein